MQDESSTMKSTEKDANIPRGTNHSLLHKKEKQKQRQGLKSYYLLMMRPDVGIQFVLLSVPFTTIWIGAYMVVV